MLQSSCHQRWSLTNVVGGGGKRPNDFENVLVQNHNMIIWHNSIATRLVRDPCYGCLVEYMHTSTLMHVFVLNHLVFVQRILV
jgi:hypothetical protein